MRMDTSLSGPILVTGASGYIAGHVVRELLERGHHVRGSLRDTSRADDLRAALRPFLSDPDAVDSRLEFVTLDLTSDDGWTEAVAGTRAVVHTASPFPMTQPRNRDDLVRPAVNGTKRALGCAASAGIRRVVLTSSVAAVVVQDPIHEARPRTARNWTDPDHRAATAYVASKTLAERRAWEIAKARDLDLTTVNPGLVLGAPVGDRFGTSVGLVRRFLQGRDPAVPNVMMDVVDVRDVARLHADALEMPATIGHRLIASAGGMWLPQIAALLKEAHPDRRIPTRTAPGWLLRLVALWDPSVKTVLPTLNAPLSCDATETEELTGIRFTPKEDVIRETATWLVRSGNV
ncbi:MAG: NAD-dependent epimerase/dehydratase family protein [Pseudooceanicola sp.]